MHQGYPAVCRGILQYSSQANGQWTVIVVADRLPPELEPGELVALDVHVVSDLRTALAGSTVTAEITWPQASGGDCGSGSGVPPESTTHAPAERCSTCG